MTRHSWRRRALAASTAVGIGWVGSLGVVACSGDPEPPAASVTPAASTPSVPDDGTEPVQGPSAGPSEPQEPMLPAAARGDSVRSAKAFVEYYIDLLNYAMVSGDTEAFRAASMRGCGGCADYDGLISKTYDRGGFYRSRGWSLDRLLVGSTFESTVQIVVTATAAPVTFRNRKGDQLKRSTTEQINFSLLVTDRGAAWSVRDFFAS